MGLRSEYESVSAALLHCNPLPSMDATIQEILFEKKCLGIILPSNLKWFLQALTHPICPSQFCKNRKLSSHKFSDCPKIECKYYHKRGHILDNCPTRPPHTPGYHAKSKITTKIGSSSVVTAASSNDHPHLNP